MPGTDFIPGIFMYKEQHYQQFVVLRLESLLLLLVLVLLPPVVWAETVEIEQLTQQLRRNHLSQHPQWLKLLHYHESLLADSGYKSYVDDDKFFFSKQGKQNPEAELIATIKAFFSAAEENDDHPVCRFPARFIWAKKHLQVKQWPIIDCALYQQWLKHINAQQLHLIFASAYLNSPSSMFGHTLFRLDPKDKEKHSSWLSSALNFGANVPADENSLLYGFKGLFGGYPGVFVVMPYYEKIQEYSYMENRGLWEYQLNLSAEETTRLLRHLWELNNINFDYYYISENCSFRLLELLEIARPGVDLTSGYNLIAIPSDVLKTVADNGFVAAEKYRPSQAVTLRYTIESIPTVHQDWIERLLVDSEAAKDAAFKQIPQALQRRIVDASYQLLRYRQTGKQREAAIAKQRFKLLKLLNSYPLPEQPASVPEPPVKPDLGHDSQMLSFSTGYRNNRWFSDLNYRLSYHDLLDNSVGFYQGAQINFFDTSLRLYEDGDVQLQKLEVLNITSISPRDRFFKPYSWRVSGGLEQQNNFNEKLTVYLNAGAGLSYSWFENHLSYNFINVMLAHSSDFRDFIEPGLGVTLGQLLYTDFGTTKLEFDSRNYLDGNYHLQLGLEHNIVLGVNHAIRFSVRQIWNRKENFNHAELGYRFYF